MSEDARPVVSALAQGVVDYLAAATDYPFARLVSASSHDGIDAVDILAEPEIPQDRTVPIEASEPIRIAFARDDACAPAVFAMRDGFPLDLVHTTRDPFAGGRSLCLWEEGWADVRRNLTPQALVERIREWLARAARGDLHQAGQLVEPLIPAASDTLILPAGPLPAEWRIVGAIEHRGRWVVSLGDAPAGAAATTPYAVFAMTLPAQVHGSLRQAPVDMPGLVGAVAGVGGDLVRAMGDWLVEAQQMATPERRAVMIVSIPMLMEAGGVVAGWETWAFMAPEPLRELGGRMGRTLYDAGSKALGLRIVRGPADLEGLELLRWRVVRRLDRAAARTHAGRGGAADQTLVAIGAGAIGSNVIINTARAGIGAWTVIDDDVVLPHNTTRQAQGDADVGALKAVSTKNIANRLLAESVADAIAADVLSPGTAAAEVERAFGAADLVVDFSASPAVLGHVADHAGIRRGASLFFSPDGRDLVVLAEDGGRALRLDEVEAQYFLAAAIDSRLAGHLGDARLDFVRYGNACQDLTRPLPPWQVQTLCGLAAGQVTAMASAAAARAGVLRLDPGTGAIVAVDVPLVGVRRLGGTGIRVTMSEGVLAVMRRLRAEALPEETGGVLVGTFDVGRAVVHVVDALPAPPDSQQAPTHFIRGKKDLEPKVAGLALRSAGALGYLGEWHSHPAGAATRPSVDDEGVWHHLAMHIGPAGAPHLMAICGDDGAFLRAGWRPHGDIEHEVLHGEA